MGVEEVKVRFGERLKAVREKVGVSQIELQRRTAANIWRMEKGEINPSLATVYSIADALGVSVEDLVKEH